VLVCLAIFLVCMISRYLFPVRINTLMIHIGDLIKSSHSREIATILILA